MELAATRAKQNAGDGVTNSTTPPSGSKPLVGDKPLVDSGRPVKTNNANRAELTFKLEVAINNGSEWVADTRYTPARIELAPARASYFERQGQRVPGVDAGMIHSVTSNLVKLNVPASRPIYQHMGIRDESLEWVGAFVGFDHEAVPENDTRARNKNAWAEYMDVKDVFRPGREVIVTLAWSNGFELENTARKYRGVIKELDAVYATAQRIYYKTCMELTNREDAVNSMYAKHRNLAGQIIALPSDPKGSLIVSENYLKAVEASNRAQVEAERMRAANAEKKKAADAEQKALLPREKVLP